MLSRYNLFDALTLACLPDQLPRRRRALIKRLGSNTTDLQRLAVLCMWRPHSNFVPVVVMLVVFGGIAVLASSVLDLFPLRDAIRVGAAIGFLMAVAPLWLSLRRLPIFLRRGGSVRCERSSWDSHVAEVRARRAAWKQFLASRHASSVEWMVYEGSGVAAHVTALACVLVGGMEAAGIIFKWSMFGNIPAFVPPLIVMMLHIPAAGLVQRRLMGALEKCECPACSYALASHPTAQGDGAGPPKCPECGTSWPLVPPPLFEMAGPDADLSGGVPQLKPQINLVQATRDSLTRR